MICNTVFSFLKIFSSNLNWMNWEQCARMQVQAHRGLVLGGSDQWGGLQGCRRSRLLLSRRHSAFCLAQQRRCGSVSWLLRFACVVNKVKWMQRTIYWRGGCEVLVVMCGGYSESIIPWDWTGNLAEVVQVVILLSLPGSCVSPTCGKWC